MARIRRYSGGARFYDVLSGEVPVYRAGRLAAIESLGLKPGDAVLDLGCGTGLNLPLLIDRVGVDGLVIGVDLSPDMLRMARARVARNGWRNVELLPGDITSLDPARIAALATDRTGRPLLDAALATYALSVTDDWRAAWRLMRSVVRPGGRAGVVDMAYPTGIFRVFAPLAWLECTLGGADINAHPWRALEAEGTDVHHQTRRGGHLHIVTATLA